MDITQLEAHLAQHPRSPLFANLALEYLSAGRVPQAISLCRQGISIYPSYATGHLVLAKCYAREGSYALALSSLAETKKYVSRFPLYNMLFQEWTTLLTTSTEKETSPATTQPHADATPPSAAAPELIPPPVVEEQQTPPDLSKEELAQIQRPQSTEADDWRIVSKTLAEIFVTQGEFDEAIVTYRLLLQERPELGFAYQTRIDELVKLREAKLLEQRESEQKSPDNAGLS